MTELLFKVTNRCLRIVFYCKDSLRIANFGGQFSNKKSFTSSWSSYFHASQRKDDLFLIKNKNLITQNWCQKCDSLHLGSFSCLRIKGKRINIPNSVSTSNAHKIIVIHHGGNRRHACIGTAPCLSTSTHIGVLCWKWISARRFRSHTVSCTALHNAKHSTSVDDSAYLASLLPKIQRCNFNEERVSRSHPSHCSHEVWSRRWRWMSVHGWLNILWIDVDKSNNRWL